MKFPAILKRGWIGLILLSVLCLAIFIDFYTSPVIFLHYTKVATAPVVYFLNEDDETRGDEIQPGATLEFRTPRQPPASYFVSISLPAASGDGVKIMPPFSRVDVYVDADTKIRRTVTTNDFWARFAWK